MSKVFQICATIHHFKDLISLIRLIRPCPPSEVAMTKPYLKDLEGMLRFRMGYNYKLQMILQRCLSDDYLDYLFDMLRMSLCIHRVWSFDLLEQVPVDIGTMLSCGRPHSYGTR